MNLIETIRFQGSITHPDSQHKTVGIDFDGVLSESSGPYNRGHFGPPIAEGLKLLRLCLEHGYAVQIFTARRETDLVAEWLRDQGFPNMHVTNQKVPASAYVDDRALPFSSEKSKAKDVIEYIKSPKKTLALKI